MGDKIVWQGKQWQVRSRGHLEEIDRGQKVPKTQFAPGQLLVDDIERCPPVLMANKAWVNLDDLLEAFRHALVAANLSPDAFARIEARARAVAATPSVPDMLHSPQDD